MAAPSDALLTYQALLRNGYSSTQAFGILANMYFESGINPESSAVDSNGYRSVGLVSFNTAPGNYPNAGSMLTGNRTADINSQVAYLAKIAGPKSAAAAGSTPGQVAGSWASRFERCQGCQPGGSQYNSRSAFAATVASWAASGNWPTSSGSGGPSSGAGSGATGSGGGAGGAGGSGGTPATTTAAGDTCLWSLGFVGCVLSKSQARAIVGGLALGISAVVVIIGADLLMKAAGLGGSGSGKALRTAGEFVALFPPAEAAGVAASAAGGHVNRTAQRRAGQRQAATAERRAATGEHRADTERSRRRSESRARQYNAQTARSSARASSRARQYEAGTARARAQTYQYRAETDRQQGAAEQRRAAAARRRSRV